MTTPEKLGIVCTVKPDNESDASKLMVNTFRARRGDPDELMTLAKHVQTADEFIRCAASNKLIIIAEQIKALQEQARQCLRDAKRDAELHHAACNFQKKPGKVYYLYKRPNETTYISMLGPEEWGPSCPHTFLGAYKLEYDMSWTKAADIERREAELKALDKLIASEVPIINIASLADDTKRIKLEPQTPQEEPEHKGPVIVEAE